MHGGSLKRGSRAIILAAVLLGCEGEGPTTIVGGDGGAVASVLILGAPTAPVMVGSEVQLAASPLNATGATLNNQTVTWESSDVTVATVSAGGLVTAVGAGIVTITAKSGGKQGTVQVDLRAGGPLGNSGGTLTMLGGKVVLTVAPGVLQQTTTYMLAPAVSAPADERLVAKTAFELAPEALPFGYGFAILKLGYDPALIPAGISATTLQLYVLEDGVWEQVRGSTVNTVLRQVTGTIWRTGIYAVMSTPVDRLTLTGSLVGGSLFVGQSATLTAKPYDALNTLLTGRIVQWTSSAPTRATVNGEGLVTALSVGTVTITATSEGKSASTTISVLAQPISDWSQVTEWTTYQGNAKHTGYVPVTANAAAFRELWVTTPFAGALNPVTTGNGRVYVTSNAYFGAQWGGALNATTGATLWSKNFGSIHGVHAPANANGTMYVTTSGHGDSYLWAFDGATGTPKFQTAYGNQWSRYYAPVIVGDAVYMAGGYYDGMYSFGATSGAQRWFAATNQYDMWTPAVDGGMVYSYTGSYSPKVTAHDATTGAKVYEIPDPSFSWSGWSMDLAPVLGGANNLLATNGGRLISFDLASRTIGWTQTASFSGSVTVANGYLYVINAGKVDVRSESTGSLVGPWVPPEGQVRGPVIVTKNLLFASTAANTYAVDLATRSQVWSYPAGGLLAISSEGTLFIAQENGKLAAVALK